MCGRRDFCGCWARHIRGSTGTPHKTYLLSQARTYVRKHLTNGVADCRGAAAGEQQGSWVRGTPTDNQRPGITTGTEGTASDYYLSGVADGEFLALIAASLILHLDAGAHRLHRPAG